MELTEMLIEVEPNISKRGVPVWSSYRMKPARRVFGRMLRPYRTLLKNSVGYIDRASNIGNTGLIIMGRWSRPGRAGPIWKL